MKKIFCILLSISTLVLLCACGSGSSSEVQPVTDATQNEVTTEGNSSKTINIGDTVTVGNWEYTLMDVVFSDDIGNYTEYENYLIPGGEKSESNPLGLEEGQTFGVVTYSIKNIGKEGLRPWDPDDGTGIGVGAFIYGDGYRFDKNAVGDRARPLYFDTKEGRFNSLINLSTLEPLSEAIECRVEFSLPKEAVDDESQGLVYEIVFGETGNNEKLDCIIR